LKDGLYPNPLGAEGQRRFRITFSLDSTGKGIPVPEKERKVTEREKDKKDDEAERENVGQTTSPHFHWV